MFIKQKQKQNKNKFLKELRFGIDKIYFSLWNRME